MEYITFIQDPTLDNVRYLVHVVDGEQKQWFRVEGDDHERIPEAGHHDA